MTAYHFTTDIQTAQTLDANDPLASFRNEFHFPHNAEGRTQIYLCGHSLGLQPKRAAMLINEELHHWQQHGVEAHFQGERPWFSYHELLTDGLAELVGALPLEVIAMNSLGVNLHLLLISFYRPTQQRFKILIERNAFPSDRYIVTSQLRLHGFDPATSLIEVSAREGEDTLRTEDILEVLQCEGEAIATVLLPGVQYLTGELLDIKAIIHGAHQQGCTVGFDLAHAIGNVPLQLHAWNVDFAVWCSYKYLNSGPGSIGGCFVHERHAMNDDLPRLAGWWGHDKESRFAMPNDFKPIPGAQGWQISNPPIFTCAPLIASLELFHEAGFAQLRTKSLQLTAYLRFLLQELLSNKITVITPQRDEGHGCQLSLRIAAPVDQAKAVHQNLLDRGFITDWREPDIIRVAPVPLYNRYIDVWQFAQALHECLL